MSRALFIDNRIAAQHKVHENAQRKVAQNEALDYENASHEARKKKRPQLQLQTHESFERRSITSFTELLGNPLPSDVTSSEQMDAYRLANYCRNAQCVVTNVLDVVVRHKSKRDEKICSEDEIEQLKQLRARWNEHLRLHFYTLWLPPPNSGGRTAAFSLAAQLWLLVAYANVVLQHVDAKISTTLTSFSPILSAYLSRNAVVVEPINVFDYTMYSLILSLDAFVARLDTLDRFERDYLRYTIVLEHCVSRFMCLSGSEDTYNAPEWCQQTPNKSLCRVNEHFITYTMICIRTLYTYAETHIILGQPVGQAVPRSPLVRARNGTNEQDVIRVPAYLVKRQRWHAPAPAVRGLLVFLNRYSLDLRDQMYKQELGIFLSQFLLRPHDMDTYRYTMHNNDAAMTQMRVYCFKYMDIASNRYRTQVHFDRMPSSYVVEAMQWRDGARNGTRSASLGTQNLTRQLALMFIFHQYLLGNFQFNFKERCMIFHRDPAFATTLPRAHLMAYPIIIQQFGYFSLLVPRHGRWPERVYECVDMCDALVNWCVWLLHMSGGKISEKVNLKKFLRDVCGDSVFAAARSIDTHVVRNTSI